VNESDYTIEQIMPPGDWVVVYSKDGSKTGRRMVGWALISRNGRRQVVGLDIDAEGVVKPCDAMPGFVGYKQPVA